jgi:hypothetical protein
LCRGGSRGILSRGGAFVSAGGNCPRSPL